MTADDATHLLSPLPDDTAAVGPRLLIRQVYPAYLAANLYI